MIKDESIKIFVSFALVPLPLKGERGDSDPKTDIVFEVAEKISIMGKQLKPRNTWKHAVDMTKRGKDLTSKT